MIKSGSRRRTLLASRPFTELKPIRSLKFSRPSSERTPRQTGTRYGSQKTLKAKGLKGKAQEAIKRFADANQTWEPATGWIEDHVYDWTTVKEYQGVYDFTNARTIKLLPYQREILDVVLTPFTCTCPTDTSGSLETSELCNNCVLGRTGRFPYSTIVWSQPKKHGKTQIAAGVSAWFSCKIEAPNICMTLASNQEQSAGLIFNSLKPTLFAQGGKVPSTPSAVPEIHLPNGTLLKAIPNNYAGAAGGNYGGTFWSELWTYKSERDRRLWEELPPVPTRKNSIRWVETYAGFEDESELLIDLFSRIWGRTLDGKRVADFTEAVTQPKAKPVPGLEHIRTGRGAKERPCCWHIPDEGLFVFWDHEIRAHVTQGGWITDQYLAEQKAENRHSTYVRLWENRWQSSEGTFIEPELWDNCVTLDAEEWGPMVLAGDASQRNDHVALVGVQKRVVKLFGKEQERYRVMLVRVWDPHGSDIDLEETIAKYVKLVFDKGLLLGPFRYDPFQMHQVAVNLRKKGVPCMEFNQGQERQRADTFLWRLFQKGLIDVYSSTVLEDHVKAANAKEYENEQVRIIKGEASNARKVDAAVALSMACWGASKKLLLPKKRHRSTQSASMFS